MAAGSSKRADDPVWLQACDRHVRVAEVDRNDRYARRAGGADVGPGIADHDGAIRLAAGAPNGLAKNLRVGFLHAERVLAANRGKMLRQVERFQEPQRQPFELVGADGKR